MIEQVWRKGVVDFMRVRWRGAMVPLAALIAVLPLLHHGCSCGHDFDFHLLSWIEAAQQFAHGSLHPHWAFTPAFNAGEPRFVFYPPISWTLGAVLGLVMTHLPHVSEGAAWNAVPIVYTWIALTLCGVTMQRLARNFVGPNAAAIAAVVYLANPYMLFTAYERTAYAELLAAAWIPLLLLAILCERVSAVRIAVPVALLWLTNAPAAVMGSYALAVLAVARIISAVRGVRGEGPEGAAAGLGARGMVSTTLGGTFAGFGLAAIYFVPAIVQRRFVQVAMATIGGMRIDQNFLFEHTGSSDDAMAHDAVLHTASVIAVVILATAAIALAVRLFLQRLRASADTAQTMPIAWLAIMVGGIALLLTPVSVFVWNHLPEAALLQFPWRLLAILAPIVALAIGGVCDFIPLRSGPAAIAGLLLATALSHAEYNVFVQPCDDEDTAAARLALFHSNAGTDPTDEYTPVTADNDALTAGDPPYWLAASPTSGPPAGSSPGPAPSHFGFQSAKPAVLVLNRREYPAWRVLLNGATIQTRLARNDGLIAVPVPAGASTIDVGYAVGADQIAGDAISVVTAGGIFLLLRRKRLY